MSALWISYGLSFLHAAIVIGDRWLLWPPTLVVLIQTASELLYAAIIYFTSGGRNWARLTYIFLLGVRTINVIRYFPDDWQDSHWLVFVTAISFVCQYLAMYWLFTGEGRRWFKSSPAVTLSDA